MAIRYSQEDGDLSLLEGKIVSILGYGNQGRAWACNLRDSGVKVIVGSIPDRSYAQSKADGFDTLDIPSAAKAADIHLLLMPDEIMPQNFERELLPNLGPGEAIVLTSGYNITFGLLKYPKDIDVLMIAPRMIGTGVRETYVKRMGFPSLVAVHQDATGKARPTMLALCRAVGTLMRGAFESSCDEETLCDLFNEQLGYVYSLRRAYELLVEAGVSPEAAMLEFWASGEEMELARVHMTHGLFHQLSLHSQTSQYGQEVTARLTPAEERAERARLRRIILSIQDGTFAKDWALEQQAGFPKWHRIRQQNLAHPMIAEEERLLRSLGVLERDTGQE
jgi:ketol-acid reductoisomerase